jgi:hypothetical protein
LLADTGVDAGLGAACTDTAPGSRSFVPISSGRDGSSPFSLASLVIETPARRAIPVRVSPAFTT